MAVVLLCLCESERLVARLIERVRVRVGFSLARTLARSHQRSNPNRTRAPTTLSRANASSEPTNFPRPFYCTGSYSNDLARFSGARAVMLCPGPALALIKDGWGAVMKSTSSASHACHSDRADKAARRSARSNTRAHGMHRCSQRAAMPDQSGARELAPTRQSEPHRPDERAVRVHWQARASLFRPQERGRVVVGRAV